MTKNGSNARKARIRAQADKGSTTYRQAARDLDDDRAAWIAASRAICHSPDNLRDERDVYLMSLAEDGSALPEMVKVCIYALTGRLGTGTLIDPRGVTCSVAELAEVTGLTTSAAENSLNVAEAHGWIAKVASQEYRLTVPGEDIDMYERWLLKRKEPVSDAAVYQRMRDQLAATTR
ncbi:hypothetical protein PYK79_15205 [Streptomyces sp. ID05-04B]|uniref:hypothetical protein n=1 Tax=Streptomyces sp. ID05-04B TaxID=3028661 RepID=UPI0029C1D8D4|nr:hypothetical protein [Streptomyces sp. ID05-04B]MDX5564398.1 hypothetical protein [Streptomyces sp. ID05-04B]